MSRAYLINTQQLCLSLAFISLGSMHNAFAFFNEIACLFFDQLATFLCMVHFRMFNSMAGKVANLPPLEVV